MTEQPSVIAALLRRLDQLTELTGTSTAWLTLVMVVIACAVVALRYLGLGSIALQESVTYMHALVFMLGTAFTLKRGGHVRVDIFYSRFSARAQAWVDALGSLLLTLPLMLFIGWSSWEFVQESWRISEGSADSGGLSIVYLLKSLLPLMALSVGLQALAELLRNLARLMQPAAANTTNKEPV
jgi:TRAP-type mannitol/chloroaromatic compound transport system permease small subunit